MKNNKYPQDQNKNQAGGPWPVTVPDSTQNGINFAPSADEVARRAYFAYTNEGSFPGRDVQHWLEAEAQLLAERNLTRVHGFHKLDLK
jgi:hypothetical protein